MDKIDKWFITTEFTIGALLMIAVFVWAIFYLPGKG